MSADYEKRKKAQEFIAERMKNSSGGKIDSDQAHRDSAKIAREQDAKNANNKPKTRKQD